MTSETCAGCKACLPVCGRKAISFKEDDEGFQIPIVDTAKCVDCGLCKKVCPAIHSAVKEGINDATKAFAFQYHNDEVRYNSASGGLFPAFAKYFVEALNGFVCGCILNDDLQVVHVVTNEWTTIQKMQDSKYVQSDILNCMREVCNLLNKSTPVLFTGTSCQCAGLLSLLKQKRISTDCLLTIDFFCHGVPSPRIWRDYVSFYQGRHNVKPIGYRFRCKKYGWGQKSRNSGFLNTFKYLKCSGTNGSILIPRANIKEDSTSFEARMWRRIFFSNIALRKYCHSCPYTTVDKPADITMGDFWGIEKHYPQFSDGKGCSMAIIRSQNALNIFNSLKNSESLEVCLEDIIERQANAFKPCAAHPQRTSFWNEYRAEGFEYVMRKYMAYSSKTKLKSMIKLMLFYLGIRNYAE